MIMETINKNYIYNGYRVCLNPDIIGLNTESDAEWLRDVQCIKLAQYKSKWVYGFYITGDSASGFCTAAYPCCYDGKTYNTRKDAIRAAVKEIREMIEDSRHKDTKGIQQLIQHIVNTELQVQTSLF